MAIRFWEEGYEYLDNMSGASTAGAVLIYDDGFRMAPWESAPGAEQNDRIAAEQMRWMAVPREELRAIRPPVPQQLFPQQFGYDQTPVTIDDVLNTRYWQPTPRSWAFPPTRTARQEFQEDMWLSSTRDSQTAGSVNPML